MRRLTPFLLIFLLVACAAPSLTGPPSPTALPSLTPGDITTPSAPTPTPLFPTPTAGPIKIGYLAKAVDTALAVVDQTGTPPASAQPMASAWSTPVLDGIRRAAQAFGWTYEWVQDTSAESMRRLAQSGANVIVADGAELEAPTHETARAFPQVYFIGVNQSGASNLPANMLALGGPETRQDQAGFVAGMAAGFATRTQRVAVVGDPNSAEGRKYRNGFLHGVRYACPKCRVDFIDVANPSDAASVSEQATRYALFGADVFFAAAGSAGDAALAAAAQKGAWVIGSGDDVYLTLFGNGETPGADHVLSSVYLHAGEAVYAALSRYHDGSPLYGVQPFSAANGALVLAPYRGPAGVLSALDRSDIAAALARLADGSLETGIDPLTGEER